MENRGVHAELARCLTFKIGNRRRLGGWWRQPDPDLGGVTEGKWKSVEGGAHRRWYRPFRTCPTPLSNAANIATRRHPPCCPTTTLHRLAFRSPSLRARTTARRLLTFASTRLPVETRMDVLFSDISSRFVKRIEIKRYWSRLIIKREKSMI